MMLSSIVYDRTLTSTIVVIFQVEYETSKR
jgi:hypothetical protein